LVALGIPTIIKALPPQLVNFPNKQYWLSPERVANTQEFLSAWFAWFGCAVYCMVLLAFDYAIQSNLHPNNRPNPAILSGGLGAFIAFTVLWVLHLPLHFAHIPDNDLTGK
jgi:hypothetical protein